MVAPQTQNVFSLLCGLACVGAVLLLARTEHAAEVRFTENATALSTGGLPCYKIETPAATYFLEKTGTGLAHLIDKEGHDWLSFRPVRGSGAGGEFRGFPNAVHRQAGSYFHPRNSGTDPSTTKVEHAGPDSVSISAVAGNGLWACRYDFCRTHCTFTMTKMPPGNKYWVLYEGTPGGQYDDDDWWMTSAVKKPQKLTSPHRGDIPAPEWIALGDANLHRVLFLVHHEDDPHPDDFYQMEKKMTVFGFGRRGVEKFLDKVPQSFSIGFLETTDHAEIGKAMSRLLPDKTAAGASARDPARREVADDWEAQYQDLTAAIRQRRATDSRALPPVNPSEVLDPESLIHAADRDPLDVVLRRTEALTRDLDHRAAAPGFADFERRLSAIKARAAGSLSVEPPAAREAVRKDLYREACRLRREAAFSNPLVDFDRLLFVVHGWTDWGALVQHNQNVGWAGLVGGGLFLVDHFRTTPVVVDVLKNAKVRNGKLQGQRLRGGSFLSPELSYDGKQILFAWSENPPGFREMEWTEDTAYHIFRVNLDGSDLAQLTFGTWNDVDPCWLPNGKILLVSERRGGNIRCTTTSKEQRNFVMHSMEPDGSGIRPISWHESCEFHPSINHDGMIVYTRWDYVDRDNTVAQHLWTCYPDGRAPRGPHGNYPRPFDTLAGWQRRYDDTFYQRPFAEFNIRAIPGSGRYLATAGAHHGQPFGCLSLLDLRGRDDNRMSQVKRITPEARFPEAEVRGRLAHQYGTAWPLSENYYLANRYQDLYLVDRFGNRELILKLSEVPCQKNDLFRLLDPIPVRPRPVPPVLPDVAPPGDRADRDSHCAAVSVMNVYDADLPLPEGTRIKWIRVNQYFPKTTPKRDQPKIGYGSESLARMSLGTAPVEADGSAYFEVPVGKMLQFQILDEKGMAVQSMRSHAFAHRGEHLSCLGCHEDQHEAPPLRRSPPLALRRGPSRLVPEAGGLEPINFHRLVKPLFVRKCVACHQEEGQGPVDLANYESPTLRQGAFYFTGEMRDRWPVPVHGGSRTISGRSGARGSSLGRALLSKPHQEALTPEEFRRVVLWLDCNSNELGAYENVEAQRRGELVWPKLDVDPEDLSERRVR